MTSGKVVFVVTIIHRKGNAMYDPDDDELFEEGWMNAMMYIAIRMTAAFGTMGTIAPMPRIMRRRKRSIGIHTNMNFRGDTVATRHGREFEQGKGRMAPTGKRRLLR